MGRKKKGGKGNREEWEKGTGKDNGIGKENRKEGLSEMDQDVELDGGQGGK